MSFLCPSVGLLKFRRFTKAGFTNSRTRGLTSKVRNHGTSVAFERAGSDDVSIASEGGFSALYGEVNPVSQNEAANPKEDSPANDGEYFAGIYIGDAGKSKKTARGSSSCQKTSDVEYFAQNPATVQSFTFFEETSMSSRHLEVEMEEEVEAVNATQNDGPPKEQPTPLSNSSAKKISPSPSSNRKRAHYHLPNWVRQRRCLPTLNEVDFDKIDAISLGSLSISSEIDKEDNNNNIVTGSTPTYDKTFLQSKSKWSIATTAKSSSAKRTHNDDLCDDVFNNGQIQKPLPLQRATLPQGGRGLSVYSPKKTKRSGSMTTDDSVFEEEPLLQRSCPLNPRLKSRNSKTSLGMKKSPSIDSLRRRSKKRETLLREKQSTGSSGNYRSKVSAKICQKKVDKENGSKDSESFRVGNLVRAKPLYMRATSERALDPSAIKMRLESSTARKWRQIGDSSPLSEVTNITQPQSSVCLRMEIVQRPVIRGEKHPDKNTMSPRKMRDSHQDLVRLPTGKIRPTPQWSKSAYSRDGSRRRGSIRRKSTEVKMNTPRPVNLIVNEKNIDNIFRNTTSGKESQKLPHSDVNQEKFGNFPSDKYSANSMVKMVQTNRVSGDPVLLSNSGLHNEVRARTTSSNNLSKINNCVCEDTELGLECRGDCSQNPFEANCSGRNIFPGEHAKKAFSGPDNFLEIDNIIVESNTLKSEQAGVINVEQSMDAEAETTEVDCKQLPPKCLVQKPRFVDNTVKEARIVSTFKEDNMAPPLPPKMMKSASFTGPSQSDTAKRTKDNAVSTKSTTRSATNVRALQTPLTQQQRRKVRRGAPGTRRSRTHRVSEVEASREDIVEVVAAMKASLDSTKPKGKSTSRKGASFVKEVIGDAMAVYDFEARNEDDVTVKIGDIVTVMNKDDPDWLFVKKHAGGREEGFLPRIFLQLKMIEEDPPKSHIASEDRRSNNSSTLSGVENVEQKNSLSLNTTAEEQNSHHLASTNQANQHTLSDKLVAKASEGAGAVAGPKELKTSDQSRARSAELRGLRHNSSSQSRDAVRDRKFNANIRGVASAVLIETYVVVNDYTPQDDDEVGLVEGEVIVVNSGQQNELDWMWVYVPRTESFGFVPAFSARPLGFHYSDV